MWKVVRPACADNGCKAALPKMPVFNEASDSTDA